MNRFLTIGLAFLFSFPAHGTTATGKISKLDFYGSGASEVIFVTVEPKVSACPYTGRYVMTTKDNSATISALLSAFHAQGSITIVGTGTCHAGWSNDEEIRSVTLTR